jgi:hypothetical protein
MAPHKALFIPELLDLIFEALAGDKAALARSAQSCRIFSNAALDMLWRSLVVTKPLMDLVPRVKRAEESVRSPVPTFLSFSHEFSGLCCKRRLVTIR